MKSQKTSADSQTVKPDTSTPSIPLTQSEIESLRADLRQAIDTLDKRRDKVKTTGSMLCDENRTAVLNAFQHQWNFQKLGEFD